MQAWRAAVHCGKSEIAELAKRLHLGQTQPMVISSLPAAPKARVS
jgi:hypothetical protein